MNFKKSALSISLVTLFGAALPAYALSPVQLTNNSSADLNPEISNGQIVWQGRVGNNWEIFHHNLASGTTTQITSNMVNDLHPQTDGNTIVWLGNAAHPEIAFHDIGSGTTSIVPAIDGVANLGFPVIANGKIAWSAGADLNDIYLYDIASGTTTNISNSPLNDISPLINGETVSWSRVDGGDPADETDDVIRTMLYDIATGTVTEAAEDYIWLDSPQRDGRLSVRTFVDGGDNDVFVSYGRGARYSVDADTVEDGDASVSGDAMVWVKGIAEGAEVYAATFTHSDGDNVPDVLDNCPMVDNENQLDTDKNGVGDACDASLPPPTPEFGIGVEFSLDVWESWSTGYCADIVVTNTTNEEIHYPYGVTFTLPENTQFDGTWSGDVRRNGDSVTVILPSWAQNIDANSQSPSNEQFGFCALGVDKPSNYQHYVPDFSQLTLEFIIHNQWNGGYCGKMFATYTGSEPYIPAPNGLSFQLAESAVISDMWGKNYYTRDGENVFVDLPYWAHDIYPGEAVDIKNTVCVKGEGVPYNIKPEL